MQSPSPYHPGVIIMPVYTHLQSSPATTKYILKISIFLKKKNLGFIQGKVLSAVTATSMTYEKAVIRMKHCERRQAVRIREKGPSWYDGGEGILQ